MSLVDEILSCFGAYKTVTDCWWCISCFYYYGKQNFVPKFTWLLLGNVASDLVDTGFKLGQCNTIFFIKVKNVAFDITDI